MKRWLPLVVLTACGNLSAPPPSMPWLTGFRAEAAADDSTRGTDPHVAEVVDTNDDESGYAALGVRADLHGDGLQETVAASAHGDLVVADEAGHILARAPALAVEGSADDLIALAVGDGQLEGSPLVVLAVQRGGHRTSTTSIVVYRMSSTRNLERLFVAPIEVNDGDTTTTGSLSFGPSQILYRAPGAARAVTWLFDAGRHRYLVRGQP